MSRLGGWSVFLGEFRRTFRTTGSIVPSSRYLARTISRLAREAARPASILEAGPGTGAFTDVLISGLQPGDSLVVVELNERFVDFLRRRIQTDPRWREKERQIRLLHGSVEDLPQDDRYHAVVCGLPFNNFDPELVDRLFRTLLDRLHPGGSFSFFEYLCVRAIKSPFTGRRERDRLADVARTIARFVDEFEESSHAVVLNVPPALVHYLRMPTDGEGVRRTT